MVGGIFTLILYITLTANFFNSMYRVMNNDNPLIVKYIDHFPGKAFNGTTYRDLSYVPFINIEPAFETVRGYQADGEPIYDKDSINFQNFFDHFEMFMQTIDRSYKPN